MPNTPLGLYYPDASTNAGLVPVLGAMQSSVDAHLTGRAVTYATRAAMLAAIPTPTPGMLANTRDWNIWWTYTGAQWRHIGSPNFTNTTVRDAQIPQPLAGDLCSTGTSPTVFWYYNGTAWVTNPIDSAWQAIPPVAGSSIYNTPNVRKIGSLVKMRGSFIRSHPSPGTFYGLGQIPVGYRPSSDQELVAVDSSTSALGRLFVTVGGAISAAYPTAGDRRTNLDVVTYFVD